MSKLKEYSFSFLEFDANLCIENACVIDSTYIPLTKQPFDIVEELPAFFSTVSLNAARLLRLVSISVFIKPSRRQKGFKDDGTLFTF